MNLWYLRPGYLRKMRKRAHDEFHQDYWWKPGETVPERGPSLEAAAGEK